MRPELGRTQYLEEDVLEVAGVVESVEVNALFGSGSLDLEGDRGACRVGEAQDLGDFVGEGACWRWICQPGVVASWLSGQLGGADQADIRLKPSSDGDSSTAMV